MTDLELTPTDLIVHVRGMDKLWSLASRLTIPLAHISQAAVDPEIARAGPHGLRVGTSLPGVITAGSFYSRDGRVFWDVHNPDQAIVIFLHDDQYSGLVIQVDDPPAAVRAINEAIDAHGPDI
ncbi:MAG TPA: hypothetical protein VFB58_06500 [Chloroflexota bacterium]|nr:hypothetical protein [Chloroflexota bacterium]